MHTIRIGNIRVQLLTENLIRLEYGKGGRFCDKNTFHIPDRSQFESTTPAYIQEGNVISFGAYTLYIPEKGRSLSGIRLEKAGKLVYSYKKLANTGELPPPEKTPEVFPLADNPRVIIPKEGYTYRGEITNTGYRIQENVQDIYLLLCEKDAKKLRQLYVSVTGQTELVRLGTLGTWNSKYYEYTEESAKQVILDYEEKDIPLDNLVIDTDWRAAMERGIGYDINTQLFPDMARFLKFAHDRNVEIIFNDHPEPVEETKDVLYPAEVKYRETNLQALMALGLDTWWYDRNWTTHLNTPVDGIPHETWGLYLFEDITRHFYQKQAKNKEIYRRPVVMGNVDNICNGKYEAIHSSASHRFGVQWTGDIYCPPAYFRQEIDNLIRGGNNCLPYLSADCGGHMGDPDKALFVRWLQFGALSPILRPHCTKGLYREPWIFDEEALCILRDCFKLRYRLLPVIYAAAYENYKTGLPMCRSLGLVFPGDKKAARCKDAYLWGEKLLVAPVVPESETHCAEKAVYLPQGQWLDPYSGKIYQGGKTISKNYELHQIPLFIRLGSVFPLAHSAQNTKLQKWDNLVYDYYPGHYTDHGILYEDDGETTAYKQGQYRTSVYTTAYCQEENAHILTMQGAEGSFAGVRAVKNREITVKFHCLPGCKNIRKVTVNGESVPFQRCKKNASAGILHTDSVAADSDVILVQFKTSVKDTSRIVFHM